MNKLILSLGFLFLSINTFAFADDTQQVITLKDGSQIKGVLSGIDNGVYTIKTPIIGDVHVAATDVASITSGNAAPVAAMPTATLPTNNLNTVPTNQGPVSSASLDQQIATNQKQIMSNPQSMQLLMQMTQDPEIMQALQDPALVQAVTSHDYSAVQSNPKIQALMTNPQMIALMQKLEAQQQQQKSQ